MDGVRQVLEFIERWSRIVAAVAMIAILVLVCVEVGLRYGFNRPTVWTYDLIGKYLLVVVFYAMLSPTYANHGHISVDILQYSLSTRMRHLCEIVSCGLAIPVFCLLTYVVWERAYVGWISHDVTSGAVAWPTWPSPLVAAIGAGLLVIRLAYTLVGHLYAITGRPGASLPPLAGDAISETAEASQ